MMNFLQSPPNHYPNSHDSTLEVFRTRNFSVTTNASSPPGYHAERAPPRYQDVTEAERGEHDTEEGRRKARKVRWVRIASSIFIVTTVALIVAGVVGKVRGMEGDQGLGDEPDKKSAAMTFTVSSDKTAHSMVQDATSSVQESVLPTETAHDESPENLLELAHENTDTTKISSTSKDGFITDHLERSVHEKMVEEEVPRPTCGITMQQRNKHSSGHVHLLMSDSQAFIDCLLNDSLGTLQDSAGNTCTKDCIIGKMAGEPIMDEWEWDSG